MGSAFTPGGNTQGVIPKVMDSIFQRISSNKDAEYTVRVGFVEIHKVSNLTSVTIDSAAIQCHTRHPEVVPASCSAYGNCQHVLHLTDSCLVIEPCSLHNRLAYQL